LGLTVLHTVAGSTTTGHLPSLRQDMAKTVPHYPKRQPTAYRAADMVKVSLDRHHRLTSNVDSPSKRYIQRTIVLYRHGIPATTALLAKSQKMSFGDIEVIAERTGFPLKELQKFSKTFARFANPTTRGVDAHAFAELFAKVEKLDPTDKLVLERLFAVANFRGAFYVTFDQCVEILRAMRFGDINAKADLFFNMADVQHEESLGLVDFATLLQTNPEDFHLLKERRKKTATKVIVAAFAHRDAFAQSQGRPVEAETITREEFLHAATGSKEVSKFCGRLGFLR